MRRYRFVQWDVFTSQPYTGNALAIFTDARGLTDGEMQSLARETNLSETTFIFPREETIERERGVQVRIFLTTRELPFAGHPTLGTTTYIRASRGNVDNEIALDLKAGRIPVRFETRDGLAFGEMTQRDPEFGETHRPEDIAEQIGISPEKIATYAPIQTVSTGIPFTIVPLRSLDAIRSVRINRTGQHFYLVTRETEDPRAGLHARMIDGFEDPATGSAAGCTAAWMARYGIARPDERILIEQGIEIQRPSQIFVRAGCEGDRVFNVRVGGHSVQVMEGEYRL